MATPSRQTVKLLWGLSGNACSMPDCRRSLIAEKTDSDPPKPIGDMAHIAGQKSGSARHDESMSDAERDAFDNLILLCPSCHDKIDKQQNTYTVERLHCIKADHLKWVMKTIASVAPDVGFPELEVAADYIASGQAVDTDSYASIAVKDKISRNAFTERVEGMIKAGLSRSNEVRSYLDEHTDARLGDKLREGFVAEYQRQKDTGITGDALFLSLADYAAGGSDENSRRVAGLAVLVYLFEACEVFKR